MREVIRLESVKKYYEVRSGLLGSKTLKALDGVTLSVGMRETVSVVGESGCGKSTLGRVSIRLLDVTSGRVLFKGVDISKMKEEELREQSFRKKMQIIFQDPYSSLNPFMRLGEIVAEPLEIHGYGKEEIRESVSRALEDVKLVPPEEFVNRYPHELSGGQRQRVNIARALVLGPEYIVADEPVSMIDASSRAEILLLLKSIRDQRGMGVLYITHDIATARYVSERIAVMYLGEIAETGLTTSVLKTPIHPYTILLLNSVPEPDPNNRRRRRLVIKGEPPSPLNPPSGCKFHTRCPIAMERCRAERPVLREYLPGHFAACHRAEEIISGAVSVA
ncbi:MAG: ABC transporter ATP-binding protein [Nitrososphaerota archaeon]|nr:ABC transporter ATP-binding protein [Candidatus Calditenuaceae archaeon]MDW8073329.1 ABC transporter ATP-binding protein [Nitrososphaerota archaeon]